MSGNAPGRPHDGETIEEIRFLESLGSWYEGKLRNWGDEERRLKLLKAYRDSMWHRERWGDIDRRKVWEAVSSMIMGEEVALRGR